MSEISNKKRKSVDRLFGLVIVYVAAALLTTIGWRNIFWLFLKNDSGDLTLAVNIAGIATNVLTGVTGILIYLFIKQLRETEKTRKLYAALIWIVTVNALFSYLASLSLLLISRFAPDMTDMLLNNSQLLYSAGNVFYYVMLFLPLPFYIAILIREKLDINWMVVGSVTNMFFILLTLVIHMIRNLLHDGPRYLAGTWFAGKYPLLSAVADNRVLAEIRGYFWIAGLIALITIYKKKFAAQKQKEEI